MSAEQKSPGGCAAIVALTVVAFIGIFVWSQISAGCSSPKKRQRSTPQIVRQAVENSPWDGSVSQVKRWIEQNAKDRRSIEYIDWSNVVPQGEGYLVRVKYRAKNSFGAYVVEEVIFVLDRKGEVLSAVPKGQ